MSGGVGWVLRSHVWKGQSQSQGQEVGPVSLGPMHHGLWSHDSLWTDRHVRTYYLPTTSLAGSKKLVLKQGQTARTGGLASISQLCH